MQERQKQLLKIIIEEYVKTAQPVASGFLVYKLSEKISSATIRNQMAELEKKGFIEQPHTSAGRVPSVLGYRFYVENYLQEKQLDKKLQNKIIGALKKTEDKRAALKILAKKIADISKETVIVAFAKNDVFYTGLSNLFAKPEFSSKELVIDISKVIDHLDKVIYNLFDKVKKIEIKIGPDCPFNKNCSVIVGNYKKDAIIAILGLTRIDYQRNFDLINFVSKIK